MAVAIPAAVEIGELLASGLASKGVNKIANLIATKGFSGAKKMAEDRLLKFGKKAADLAVTAEGRDKLLHKVGKLGNKAEKAAEDVGAILNKTGILRNKNLERYLGVVQGGSKGFHKFLGSLGKLNKVSKLHHLFG